MISEGMETGDKTKESSFSELDSQSIHARTFYVRKISKPLHRWVKLA
jgi:hypothetical protein